MGTVDKEKAERDTDEALVRALYETRKQLVEKQKPLDPELRDILEDHFWDLCES